MNFDSLKVSGISASFTRIVSDEKFDWDRIFMSVGACSASIGDSATGGDLMLIDAEDGVRAFDIARRKPSS